MWPFAIVFAIGGLIGVGVLVFLGKASPEEVEKFKKTPSAEYERYAQIKRDLAFADQPNNFSSEEVEAAYSRRQNFQNKMSGDQRAKFMETVDGFKSEMDEMKRLSPEELGEKARSMHANEFRLQALQFFILFMCFWMWGAWYFKTNSFMSIWDKFTDEFMQGYGKIIQKEFFTAVDIPTAQAHDIPLDSISDL